MFSLFLILVTTWPAFASIENLECELSLSDGVYQVASNIDPIPIGPEQIVIRGRLRFELDPEVKGGRWYVRDDEGSQKIFANFADSLHPVDRGDQLYLLDKDGSVFRHGYFDLIAREHLVRSEGETHAIDFSPQIFVDPHGEAPLLGSDALATHFEEAHAAVLVKNLPDVERRRLRERLLPQIEAYHAHMAGEGRFVQIGRSTEIEMLVFEEKFEGPLRYSYVDAAGRVRGVTKPGEDDEVRMVLWIEDRGHHRELRTGDRVFLLNEHDDVVADYRLRAFPVRLTEPLKDNGDVAFNNALGRRRRAVVIRRADR